MNFYKRGMIFVTFLGCCLALGLLVGALGTPYWVLSTAERIPNTEKSDGSIHFGIFTGRKSLNVGYGTRTTEFQVEELMLLDADAFALNRVYWWGTVGGLTAGLLLATLSAILAALNTAVTPASALPGIPGIYLCNSLAVAANVATLAFWGVAFHKSFQYNVLTREDLENHWTTDGKAYFGFSFWLVIGAAVVHILNILILAIGTRDRESRSTVTPVVEEKTNGAIMLY
ncbi:clarin-2-like [Neocloeon triangulifer]|uniref:clarin-2-like n=1 Tax=Neocloeon triangulifer TaxID=2078957 RepID=UPI00286F1DC0|nr:clarin-2-like [Neocloeon triangulifer]